MDPIYKKKDVNTISLHVPSGINAQKTRSQFTYICDLS